MATRITPSKNDKYYINPATLTFVEDSGYGVQLIQVSASSSCYILVYDPDNGIRVNEESNIRRWKVTAYNNKFPDGDTTSWNIYVRLERIGSSALVVYDKRVRAVSGAVIVTKEDGTEETGSADPDYYYIKIGSVGETDGSTIIRKITYDTGYLDTYEANQAMGELLTSMFIPHFDDPNDPTKLSWIEAKSHMGVQGGVTMFVEGEGLDLPSIYDGLPLDNDTIYWEEIKDEEGNVIGKKLKARTNEGSADFSNVLSSGEGNAFTSFVLSEDKKTLTFVKDKTFATVSDLDSRVNALVNGAPAAYDTLKEIADVLQGNVNSIGDIVTALGGKANKATTLAGYGITDAKISNGVITLGGNSITPLTSHQTIYNLTLQAGTFSAATFDPNGGAKTVYIPTTTSHISEGINLYFTNARAVSALSDTLKAYVTLSGTQTITGEKDFTGGLKVNGSPIVYDKTNKCWKFDGNLLVTGGITMYGTDGTVAPTIWDGAPKATTSNTTNGKGVASFDSKFFSVSNGHVTFIGDVGGLDESALASYLSTNKYLTQTTGDARYLAISGNAVSAGMVKGKIASNGNSATNTNKAMVYYSEIPSTATNIPTSSGYQNSILSLGLHSNGATAQLFFSASQSLYYRPNVRTNWNEIAYTTSNVASATTASKLSTVSKTAWGQTYWTSGGVPTDVSGSMTGVGSITMNGELSGATKLDVSVPITKIGDFVLGSLHSVSNLSIRYSNAFGVYGMVDYNSGAFVLQAAYQTTPTALDILLQPRGGNVAIGKTSATCALDVNGTIKGSSGSFSGNVSMGSATVNGGNLYYDSTYKYWKLEGDLLVTGGVTMYGVDGTSFGTIWDNAPKATTTDKENGKGVASFDSKFFSVTNGHVTFIGDVGGDPVDVTELDKRYVTLSGTQSVTGEKTFESSIKIKRGFSILDDQGWGIVGVNPTEWTGLPTDGSAIGFGTGAAPVYIRTSGDDLYHYDKTKDAAYKIIDSNNIVNYKAGDSIKFNGFSMRTDSAFEDKAVDANINYIIDATLLSASYFYPVIFPCSLKDLYVRMYSTSGSAAAAYNQNKLEFTFRGQGWMDAPNGLTVHFYSCYDAKETTIGCIAMGEEQGYKVVWVRGGLTYYVTSNITPTLYKDGVTFTNEKYSYGVNYYGGTNTKVKVYWTPQATSGLGAMYHSGSIGTYGSLNVKGISIYKSDKGYLFIDGDLVVKGGITMYGTDGTVAPTIWDGAPKATTSNTTNGKGVASFDSKFFSVSNGHVTFIGDVGGLDESALASYLSTNKYLTQTTGDARYLALGGNAVSASGLSGLTPIISAANESNEISAARNSYGAITTNAPTSGAAITNALKFRWYDTDWQIGNVRNMSNGTSGFGVTYGSSNLRFLVKTDGIETYGTLKTNGVIPALNGSYSLGSSSYKWASVYASSFEGNATSATTASKLSITSKTAWGQTYWTSGGVPTSIDGNMSNVGHITMKGNNSYDIGTSSVGVRYIYANWIGATSGGKFSIGANNGTAITILTDQKVGFGTTSPKSRVQVDQSEWSNGITINRTVAGGGAAIAVRSNGTHIGNFGINGSKQLEFNVMSGSTAQVKMTVDSSGNGLFYGGVTMYSDIRKKTILNHVELSLKEVADAPLIEHYYNSDEKKTTHVGSVAQYWAGLNDWFCKEDGEGFLTMEIQNAALASAISVARELTRYESKTDKQIKKLKKRIGELEEEIENLKNK